MPEALDDQPGAGGRLHPTLEHLGFLVGRWHGLGVGGYVGTEDFRFEQEVEFSHDGRPFLAYASKSWLIGPEGGRLAQGASETGWWRPGAEPREVEVLLAHHTGTVEIYLGTVAFTRVELVTDVVARTHTAKDVTAVKRLYGLVEGDLAYAVDMAAEGHALRSHLSARLHRRDD